MEHQIQELVAEKQKSRCEIENYTSKIQKLEGEISTKTEMKTSQIDCEPKTKMVR